MEAPHAVGVATVARGPVPRVAEQRQRGGANTADETATYGWRKSTAAVSSTMKLVGCNRLNSVKASHFLTTKTLSFGLKHPHNNEAQRGRHQAPFAVIVIVAFASVFVEVRSQSLQSFGSGVEPVGIISERTT